MTRMRGEIPMGLRLRIWRARFSIPGLLSRCDDRKVVALVTAFHGGLALLTISLFAWQTDLPLVFPALGPSAFILFSTPLAPGAAPRNLILGHIGCLVLGYGIWQAVSFLTGSPVSMTLGGLPMICSATLGLAVSCLFLIGISCPHPPACTSCLVVSLGIVTNGFDLLLMAMVVVWLTFQAVAMNRLAGLPVPVWSPRLPSTL